jgi:hypothetical protein
MTLNERGPTATIDDDLRWSAASPEHACPVCGARSGCGVAPFQGGVAVDCRWTASATPMTEGGWLHRLSAADVVEAVAHSTEGAACAFPMPKGLDVVASFPTGTDLASAPPTDGRGPIIQTGGAAMVETVLGAFETRRLAQGAVDDLRAAGFRADQLSVVGRHDGPTEWSPQPETTDESVTDTGIVGTIGEFGSLAVGMISAAIPGIGPVVALGPLSVGLSAALRGGLTGGLVGLFTAHGVPDHDAARYAARVGAGEYVVAVHTEDAARAESILIASGAGAPVRHARAP